MPTNIKIGYEVSSNGTVQQETKEVNNLDAALKRVAQNSSRIPKAVAAAKQSAAAMENLDAGAASVARAIGPGTGAAGRDFAKQAEGLGGLVRVYATFAANIYAVSAAFTALSKAMDTTNMIKGLDQLGASSGVAMGTLSKRLVTATDNAISLREAMEATAKAVSSGMKSDDILRLGNVAKQASQALGVNMSDAISRLTRGITKLEPELLDELGIFTKLDPAVKEYAKSVNKSVSELTDFERRAAFANAVLAEGEKKFNAIDIAANPYTKLSASIQNAAQDILSSINKILGPIAEFFSQSPKALLAGIAAIAGLLVKQALPAIGQFRTNLENAAQQAAAMAQKRALDAQAARKALDDKELSNLEKIADEKLAIVDETEKKLQNLKSKSASKIKEVDELSRKNARDLTKEDFDIARSAIAAEEARGGKKSRREASKATELVNAIEAQAKAENALKQSQEDRQAREEKLRNSAGAYGATIRGAAAANEIAAKKAILSNAAYFGSILNLGDAFKLLKADIDKAGLTGLDAKMMKLRGTLAIVAGSIGTVLNGFNGLLMAIGTVTAVVGILDSIFSKATKQLSAFDSSIDNLESSVKLLGDTYDKAYKDNPFSVDSLEAQSNALVEFSSSMDSLASSAQKALLALKDSAWDNFKNSVKGFVGLDVQSSFEEAFGENIVQAIDKIDDKELSAKLALKIGNILNIKDVNNVDELTKSLNGLGPTSAKVKAVNAAIKDTATNSANAASRAREYVSDLKKSEDAFKSMSKEFEVKNTMVEWANSSITALTSLTTLLKQDTKVYIDSLIASTENLEKNPIFGSASIEVSKFNIQLKEAKFNMLQSENAAKVLQDRLSQLSKARQKDNINQLSQINDSLGGGANASRDQIYARIDSEISLLQEALVKAKADNATAQAKVQGISVEIQKSINKGLTDSINVVSSQLTAALSKGSTQLLQGVYASIDNIPELATKQFDLKIRELESQANSIKVQQDLANKTEILAQQIKQASALEQMKIATEEGKNATTPRAIDNAAIKYNEAVQNYEDATKNLNLLELAAKDPIAALVELRKQFDYNSEGAKKYAKSVTDAANRNVGFIKQGRDIAQSISQITLIDKPSAAENARAKQDKEAIDNRLKLNALAKEEAQINLGNNVITKTQFLNQSLAIQGEQVRLDFENKRISASNAYNLLIIKANALAIQGKTTDAERVYQQAEALKLFSQTTLAREEANRLAQIELDIRNQILQKDLELIDAEYRLKAAAIEVANIKSQTAITLREIQLQTAQETEKYSQDTINQMNTSLAIFRINEEAKRQEMAATNEYNRQLEVLNRQMMNAGEGTPEAERIARETKLLQDRYAAEKEGIRSVAEARTQSTVAISKAKSEQDAFNRSLEVLKTLDNVFEGWGTSLADIAVLLKESTTAQSKYNEEVTRLNDMKKTVTDDQDRIDIENKLSDLSNQRTKDEITNNAKILGSAKKLFKEKTGAYRVLAATEKVLHLTRLAMDVKELASKLFTTKTSVAATTLAEGKETATKEAGALARLPTYIGEIYGKTIGQLGPIAGPVVAAALVAYVVSLFGKGGKGGGGPPKGFTAEEQQKVQGTSSYFKDGKLMDTGAGVLGTPGQKSESVANGIANLEKYSFSNLEYSNKMLDALVAIRENTREFAGTILKAIPGITKEIATVSSGNFWTGKDSTEVLDRGIKVIGTIGQIIDKSAQVFEYRNLKNVDSSFFGLDKDTSYPVQNLPIADQRFLQSLSGIFVNMQEGLSEAAKTLGVGGAEEIKTAFRALNLSDQLTASLMNAESGEDVAETLLQIISNGMDTATKTLFPWVEKFQQVGEAFGDTIIRVANDMRVVNLSLEEIGFTLPKLVETGARASATQLQRVTSAQKAYDAALLETQKVNQVVMTTTDQNQQQYTVSVTGSQAATAALIAAQAELNAALKDVEITNSSLTTKNIEMVEGLIKAAGGLDKFVEKAKFFGDNFLTESQRLQPIYKNVTEELGRLDSSIQKAGFSSITSRRQFADLVLSLQDLNNPMNVSTEAGKDLYTALQNLAPAADTLLDALEASADRIDGFQIRLLEITGEGYEAILRKRQKTLDDIESEDEKDLQRAIFLAEDISAKRKIELELIQALGFSYEATLISRQQELSNLSAQQRAVKELIYATQDRAKTTALETELLEASGNSSEALRQKRIQELKGLSKTDQALKIRIWRLQDEKKALDAQASLEERIYNLLGNKSAALAYTRQKEIAATDEALRPALLYVYALEDEAALKEELEQSYQKQNTTLQSTVSGIRESIRALKDYKQSLLIGDLSPLTPEQKYQQAKQEALRLAAVAASTATTEAERIAKDDALAKLPGATDAWLQASRTLFASSATYSSDFQQATSMLDTLELDLSAQLSEAEKQLKALEASNVTLKDISTNTRSTADILADLLLASERVEERRRTAAAAGFEAAGGTGVVPALQPSVLDIQENTVQGAYGVSMTEMPSISDLVATASALNDIDRLASDALNNANRIPTTPPVTVDTASNNLTGLNLPADHWLANLGPGWLMGTPDMYGPQPTGATNTPITTVAEDIATEITDTIADIIPAVENTFKAPIRENIQEFARGGIASGLAMVGEQGPELVDFNTPGRIYSANDTATMLGNTSVLINEIKALRQEVAKLREEQREQTGHIITTNYDANNRAAEKIAETQEQSVNSMNWKEKLAPKII